MNYTKSKFQDELTEQLWEQSLDFGYDDSFVHTDGDHFGLLGRHILKEDGQGFVWSASYDTPEHAADQFSKVWALSIGWED